MTLSWIPGTEPVVQKFEAARKVFSASCAHLWANEVSHQAWYERYVIG